MNPLRPEASPLDSLGHFCGVAGVRSKNPSASLNRLFYMLYALQHRGQESFGVATLAADGTHQADLRLGMVSGAAGDWLSDESLSRGGVGHVRYSTQGGGGLRNAQPISVECTKGRISLAHNGNISNSSLIRRELFSRGAIFRTTSDSELILHRVSRSEKSGLDAVLADALGPLEGAYSLCLLWDDDLIAVRDPKGFRPLHLGIVGDAWVVASETCAIAAVGGEHVREIEPGEAVAIGDGAFGPSGEPLPSGIRSFRAAERGSNAHCVFELLYFARPDSTVFGESVLSARKRFGRSLGRAERERLDVVVPVPDSGTIAALGFSEASGVPFDFGFTRNHYAGRSFIMPSKGERELAVRIKLHANREIVEGKRVAMVDDSLVRGTTAKIIVGLLREAGAREVHLRLAAPELKWPCYYGIDIPNRDELISNRMDPAGVASFTGADTAAFLPVDALTSCVGEPGAYCYACFDGRYPCPVRARDGT
jgi:amidophosphoribosyltransferase